MSEEKRRLTRIPFNVGAEITANDALYRSDGILNLSVGGCLLPIKANLDPGTECQMKIMMIGASSELSIPDLCNRSGIW
ncbi:MAG: PilZ domain-containing protein [Desulfobacteraceae bacterium]|nr:PilZ domain-containing protein [Desulfobacteraceae bacterium]